MPTEVLLTKAALLAIAWVVKRWTRLESEPNSLCRLVELMAPRGGA